MGMIGIGVAASPLLRKLRRLTRTPAKARNTTEVQACSLGCRGIARQTAILHLALFQRERCVLVRNMQANIRMQGLSACFYMVAAAVVMLVIGPWMWFMTGEEPFSWAACYVLLSPHRLMFAAYWVMAVTATLLALERDLSGISMVSECLARAVLQFPTSMRSRPGSESDLTLHGLPVAAAEHCRPQDIPWRGGGHVYAMHRDGFAVHEPGLCRGRERVYLCRIPPRVRSVADGRRPGRV
jgi:hypothetical protein